MNVSLPAWTDFHHGASLRFGMFQCFESNGDNGTEKSANLHFTDFHVSSDHKDSKKMWFVLNFHANYGINSGQKGIADTCDSRAVAPW